MQKYLVSKKPADAIPLSLVSSRKLKQFCDGQPKFVQNWIQQTGFKASSGTFLLVPDRQGNLKQVIAGVSDIDSPWSAARLPEALPKKRYVVTNDLTPAEADNLMLGWLLGTYRFDRYKKSSKPLASLVAPPEGDQKSVRALAAAIALGRDLITTPAEDMGPEQLAAAAKAVAEGGGARFSEIVGDKLLEKNYPAVHAVGRASSRAPRLIDFVWGSPKAPKVTLVGKGVCFDSGGLDIKPADAMKLMKKDMGGAATVLSLAQAIMETKLPVRLRVLVPAVENSISSNAFRPLDVLQSRKGLTIEVGHTDAEGRLILCDALTEADSEKPDLLIDIATLTGAARVALGTELPALFSTDDAIAQALMDAGTATHDPFWRLPLHKAYRSQLNSRVAHLSNVGTGPYGGAITAALFLKEFVGSNTRWVHIDTMAYMLSGKPGRPAGGEVFGVRALLEMLRRRYAPEAT